MLLDVLSYLHDDILTKVDRASMAASLETRMPMLNEQVAQFAWSLPTNMKIRNGKNKWILRKVLKRHIPKNLIERPKQGFSVPLADWLRGPLKTWSEELLNFENFADRNMFNEDLILKRFRQHQLKERDWHNWLWPIIMFQQWRLDRNV